MASVRFLQLDSYDVVSHVHLKVWVVYPKHDMSSRYLAKEYSSNPLPLQNIVCVWLQTSVFWQCKILLAHL